MARGPNPVLSAIYRAKVQADPVGFSAMMSERTKRAWAEGKCRRKSKRTPQDEEAIRLFAAQSPRLPWKILAFRLGVTEPTIRQWRKAIGLPMETKPK